MRAANLMMSAFHLHPGAYEIRQGQSAFSAARLRGRGRQYIVDMPLNNIRTREELAEKASEPSPPQQERTPRRAFRPGNDKALRANPENAMALFIADNYELYWNTSAEEFIKKIGERYKRFWNAKRKSQAADLGLTPAQVAVIASIADEESSKADEKRQDMPPVPKPP